jgi:sporulation protein YlmC with PRC-barrel domain
MIRKLILLTSMSTVLTLSPAYAMDCTDADLKKMQTDIDAMTDATMKQDATKHLTMAMDSMKQKDTTACMSHMDAAMKAMGHAVGTTPAFAAQDVTEMLKTVPGDSYAISEFYRQDVYDEKDNKIGDINDVLLDKNGQLTAVILGVGGVLGLGEKDVAVPFKALHTKEKDGKRYLVINTTKEALESAPGYTFDRVKHQWFAATKQPGLAASEFGGVWKVQDSNGKPFQITLSGDGSAKADRGEGMTGTWKDEGGAAVIKWDTGWTNKITKEGNKYKKTAYEKGKPLEGPPTNSSDAEKVE